MDAIDEIEAALQALAKVLAILVPANREARNSVMTLGYQLRISAINAESSLEREKIERQVEMLDQIANPPPLDLTT